METYKIEKLPDLLTNYLEPNTEITEANVTKLPQGGYGSIMLQVDLKLKNQNGCDESKHLVAKVLPASEVTRKLFNIQVTYKKEVNFYTTVLPILKDFQKENGVEDSLNFFPKFYGARINLDGNSDVVTDDAVLVLENLIELGYSNLGRGETFDLETTRVIVRDIAKLHGTTIGLKLKKPKAFNDKIKVNCMPFDFNSDDLKMFTELMKAVIVEHPQCAAYADKIVSFFYKQPAKAREPYATMAHCDLWVNNLMQKSENGQIKNILVDFQLLDYRSCASDIFFFLWTSVQKLVLEERLDDLLAFYHDQLVTTLQELNCDTSEFSLDKFYEEIKLEAGYEFGHAFFFSFGTKNPNISVTNVQHNRDILNSEELTKIVPVSLKEFLWFMTLECSKRGWIY